jgi:hypothetical protein
MRTPIFHHAKNIIFKNSSKRNQNPLTSIWRQKKYYENSNISSCKKYNLQKLLYKKPKSFNKYLQAKEVLCKLQYFTLQKI